MTKPFIFSGDAHIAEPADLYREALPANLQQWAIWTDAEDKNMLIKMGDKTLLKVSRDIHDHKTGKLDDPNVRRLGGRNLDMRLKDMARDGVDSELVFPGIGLVFGQILDREAQRISARTYNDWAWAYTEGLRDTLVAAALLPFLDMDDTIAEAERVIAMGYRTVMIPSVLPPEAPQYNDPAWDRLFALCGEKEIPICIHTATGYKNVRPLRGPGAAAFNYTTLMCDAINCVAMLTCSGILDRNPKTKVVLSEYGAGWLLAVGERMDEAYFGHAPMVQPKLNRLPSQIVKDQIVLCMQNDVGALKTLREQGVETVIFATDYPHSEGTFPYSMELVDRMFDDVPELTQEEREAVLGMTGVKLFKIDVEKARNPVLPAHAAVA